MKITPKQYALSLYESVKDKDKKEAEKIIRGFAELLVRENVLARSDKIIAEFSRIWNAGEGLVEAEITSARPLDKAMVKAISNYIKERSKAGAVEIKTAEDKDLLGGVVVRFGDKILDASLKTKLSSLKQEMKK